MNLAGFQKLTLIDYPGQLATTVFTVGCSFRCPFCHNPELVERGAWRVEHNETEKDFFEFLKKRHGKLTGVCITGGEPTIQSDLIEFMVKIKKMGFLVKLDTNGTRPDVLKKILDARLADFVAMDIKNQPKKYDMTVGLKSKESRFMSPMIERVKLSVDMIRNSRIQYEFRTTVVPGIHREEDFLEIAKWLSGAKSYWLQRYQEIKILDPRLRLKTKGKKLDLEKIRRSIEKSFGEVGIRG